DTEDVFMYGSIQPVRTLITSSVVTFSLAFGQSSPRALEVYHRLELGTLEPDAEGAFDFKTGGSSTQRYAFGVDMVDGDNHIRVIAPECEVTEREEFSITAGEAVTYGVTLTALLKAYGAAMSWFNVVGIRADVVLRLDLACFRAPPRG